MIVLKGPHYLFHVPEASVDVRKYGRQEAVTMHVPSLEHGGQYELRAVIAAEDDVTWYTAQLCMPYKEQVPSERMEPGSVLDGADAEPERAAPRAVEQTLGKGAVLSVASIGEPGESIEAVLDGLGTGLCNLFCHVFGDERCFGSPGQITIEEAVDIENAPAHPWHGLRAFAFRDNVRGDAVVYLPNVDAPVATEEELFECSKLLKLCLRVERRKDSVAEHHSLTEVPLVWGRDDLGHLNWLNRVRLTEMLSRARERGGIFSGIFGRRE